MALLVTLVRASARLTGTFTELPTVPTLSQPIRFREARQRHLTRNRVPCYTAGTHQNGTYRGVSELAIVHTWDMPRVMVWLRRADIAKQAASRGEDFRQMCKL
jgi:hypothetical protein